MLTVNRLVRSKNVGNCERPGPNPRTKLCGNASDATLADCFFFFYPRKAVRILSWLLYKGKGWTVYNVTCVEAEMVVANADGCLMARR